MRRDALMQVALDCGAAKAILLPAEAVVLSGRFRDICETNACGLYGRCWMCPPDVGRIDALMATLRTYHDGLWYQTIGRLEDSFDIEGMQACGAAHAQVTLRIREALRARSVDDALYLSCGGCRVCETCAKVDDAPCRRPGDALPSLESYGVDVYQTTRDTDLRYINGQNTVTFFGMVLFREMNDAAG